MLSSTADTEQVGLGAFLRPTLSLLSAMAAALLCGMVVYMAAGGTDSDVSRKWIAASLLTGVVAVALGVVGLEDGRRGKLACGMSMLLVLGVIALYYLAGPAWTMAL